MAETAGDGRSRIGGDESDAVSEIAADLIRFDTSNRGGGDCRERSAAEYVATRLSAAGLDPKLLESAPGRANVVARLAGTAPDRPALLVHGHLDVVPAHPADWRVPPFSGDIRDGVVWGRGAVDMKGTIAMVLALVEAWAEQGRRPPRDLVLAFTADEEDTARYGAGFLVEHHAELFEGCTEAIGESGGYAFHAAEGVRVYPVAAGERGTAWLRLTARGRAGHGSKANPDNAVTRLATAVARIGSYEWPERVTPLVQAALDGLHAALGPDLGPAAALVTNTLRNSANPTMLDAGYKVNVIPASAVAYVDGRVLPGHEEEFAATLDELTGADATWEFVHREIPLVAPHEGATFAAMRAALRAADPGAHVVPYCMSGGTDAKQFSRLGIAGYGFAPLGLPPGFDYHAMFHGVDERVPVEALRFGVGVLDSFLMNC